MTDALQGRSQMRRPPLELLIKVTAEGDGERTCGESSFQKRRQAVRVGTALLLALSFHISRLHNFLLSESVAKKKNIQETHHLSGEGKKKKGRAQPWINRDYGLD